MSDPALRWRGAVAACAVLVVAGLAASDAVVVLSALVPLAFVAYGSLTAVELPESVVATRRIEPTPAPPGRPVTVTLTVRNDSGETLSDVRLADGVPEALAVTRGSPRAGTTLEPGEDVTVRYVLVARRGEHAFDPPRVRLRSLGGGAVTTVDVDVGGDEELVCRLDADAPPLEEHADQHVGQLTADSPGRGVEFHSTREYRHGDDASRIDWRHYAKRGRLSTVNYQERRSATVVVVVDAREAARVVSGPGRPTAVELEAYAATHAITEFLRVGHDIALAVVGLDGPGPAGLHWLPGGSGSSQRVRALDLLRTAAADPARGAEGTDAVGDDADAGGGEVTATGDVTDGGEGTGDDADPLDFDTDPKPDADQGSTAGHEPGAGHDSDADEDPDDADADDADAVATTQVRKVMELAPPGAQLALFSPLLDDLPVTAVETWRAHDYPVVVLSPDVVTDNTTSGQYAQVRRRTRLARCQGIDARSIDWRRGTPLPIVLEYAFAAEVGHAAERSVGHGAGGDR